MSNLPATIEFKGNETIRFRTPENDMQFFSIKGFIQAEREFKATQDAAREKERLENAKKEKRQENHSKKYEK